MSHKSDDFLFKDVNPIPSADEDLLCNLLNQLESNLNNMKPFVNQLLGIISINDQTEQAMTSRSNGYRDDTLVLEGLESPPACVVEDLEMHNFPVTEITLYCDSHLVPVDNGSDLVTSKTSSINLKLSYDKEVITVFNSIKAIEAGTSENTKLFTTDLSGDSSGAAISNSFQAEMDGDSGGIVSQVSSVDLSLSQENVDYWLARNFLACWIFFYMNGNDFYRYSPFIFNYGTSILAHMNAVMIYILITLRQVQLDYYFFKLDENDNHAGIPLITSLVLRDSINPYRDDLVDYLADKNYYCLGRNFKDGFVLKGFYRTSLDLGYKKADVFRQIKLDDYLFAGEWNLLDFVLLIYYPGGCLSIGITMIDNPLRLVTLLKVSFVMHPCVVVKITEQCEENCHRLNQNRKDNLAHIPPA